jgi:hypothetical protein
LLWQQKNSARISNNPYQLVDGFKQEDFRFWFDENLGHTSPILSTVLDVEEWSTILQSGDVGLGRLWEVIPVSVERSKGEGCWRICQVELHNRLRSNPVAALFAQKLLNR